MLKIIVAFALLFILCFGIQAKSKMTPSPNSVNELLWWLPVDTETVMVAKGPITIASSEPEKFIDFTQRIAYGSIDWVNKGDLKRQLEGKKILLSLEGCRKFRSPKSLGSSPYEGCQIIIFDNDFSTARNSIIHSLEVSAKAVLKIGEFKVSVFEEKLESDIWEFYLVSPKSDILLLATDQSYLTEVLNRMKGKKEIRALPDSLKEWKYVDTNAQYWAIRHYDINNLDKDPTSPLIGIRVAANFPDKEAIGIVSMFHPGKPFVVRYLSSNKDAVNIQREFWTPDYFDPTIRDKKPDVRLIELGIVEVTYSPDNQTTMTLFLYMAAFGHAIFV
ncbi:MAG: hypothetical protein HY231_16625 [Acidobacteria bacterium]|nr:hypothetical protein [Acidobacteriota bacterium]